VIDHEQTEQQLDVDVPQLPSNAFTPLIGSLLLSANPRVGDGARLAIVELLNRLQGSETSATDDRYCPPSPLSSFGEAEKEIIIKEIMNGVVLGMGRLDSEFQEGGEIPIAQSNTDEGPSPGQEYRREETPVRGGPTPPDDEHTATPPDGSILLYRTPSRREVPDRLAMAPVEGGLHDPAVAAAPFLDYFDSPITRERHIDADGWVTAPPQEDAEEMNAAFQSQGTPHTVLNERLNAQELATIDEEEPVNNDTGEEATVGRVASMSVVAAIAANGKLSRRSYSDEMLRILIATMPLHMQEVFVQEVVRVGFDSVYWVRREASFAIGALAKVVPLEMVTAYLVSAGTNAYNVTDIDSSFSYRCIQILSEMTSGMSGILFCLLCQGYWPG
jgi:serine/threonine-protein phosphatase 4 regulatory subunit 1